MLQVLGISRRSARVVVLCGPARSGKTERLLARYRAALVPPPAEKGTGPICAEHPLGRSGKLDLSPFPRVLWLAPTWRAAAEVRQRLFDGDFAGCFSPGVMTFEKFAEAVLHAAGIPLRPITRLMKRELVRQIIAEQSARGRLAHFQSIAATGGLVDMVCEFIGELKRLEIWPEEFHRACAARSLGDKDVELFEIYDAYQQSLREHGLFDAEGRFWSARDVLARGAQNDERGMMSDELTEATSTVGNAIAIHHSSFIIHHLQLVVVDGFTDFTRTQHEIIEILAARAKEIYHAAAGAGAAADRSVRQAAEDVGRASASPRRCLDRRGAAAAVAGPVAGHGTLGANTVRESQGRGGKAGDRGSRVQGSGFRIERTVFRDF